MTFEEWFETPEAEHLDLDHAKIAWFAGAKAEHEAERDEDSFEEGQRSGFSLGTEAAAKAVNAELGFSEQWAAETACIVIGQLRYEDAKGEKDG
jgi:hypothetical protein